MAGGAPGSDSSRDSFRDVVVAVGIDQPWLDLVATKISAAIHDELPELDGDEDLATATLQSSRSILSLFLATLESDLSVGEVEPPPQALAYAREFVHRGLSVETLIRTYQVGQACFYRCFAEEVRDSLDDPEAVATAMEQGARWTFEFVEGLLPGLLRHYAQERDRWVRSAAAVRRETVRALLAGGTRDPHEASARLGYRLDGHHCAFVLWTEDETAGDAAGALLESTAAELAERLGAARRLLVPGGPTLVSGWLGSDLASEPGLEADSLLGAIDGMRVAFGTGATGVAGFVRSHREAMDARRVARRSPVIGAVVVYSEVSLVALAGGDHDLARQFVVDELGALAGEDEATRQLGQTALAYLETLGSPRRTAQLLGVHENTISNRIRRVEELLGRPLDRRLAETLLALRLAELGDGGASLHREGDDLA
jgi:PucR C-terminal helix-turn-helix domain/GGDEF-like domain